MTESKKPLHEISLTADSSKGSDTVENLPSRITRYGLAKARAVENYNWLVEYGKSLEFVKVHALNGVEFHDPMEFHDVVKLTHELEGCANWMLFHHYYTIDKVRLANMKTCKKHLMCPLCAIRRGSKALQAYLERFEVISSENPVLRPYLLTLTVTNSDDLSERFEHLQKSFKKYTDRRRDADKKKRGYCELNKVHGAVFTYEFTHKDNGWHPHIHMVCMCDPNDLPDFPQFTKDGNLKKQSKLAQEWLSITGDSYIVDIRAIEGDPIEGFIEVFKYALKFSELSPEDNYHAYRTLRGKRLQGSFGLFWGVKVPEKMTDDLFDELPYLELFYRYTRAGYSLEKTKLVEI